MRIRPIARCLAAALALFAGATLAAWPEKPVKIIVPFPAGGASDATARALAQGLARRLSQPVVVENRPGASGALAAQSVMAAAPDGYTILWGTASMVALPLLLKSPPFASMGELAPVATVGTLPFSVLVHPSIPAKTLAELAEHARRNPGALNFATGSVSEYFAGAQLQKAAGVTMEHVPYKGGAQLMPDLVAGRLQVNIGPASTAMPYVKSGRLRALAILLPARSSLLPDVPTAAEAGFAELAVPTWQALLAPPRTPPGILERLSREVAESVGDPQTLAQFERIGVLPSPSTPETLAARIRTEAPLWARFAREHGIEAE